MNTNTQFLKSIFDNVGLNASLIEYCVTNCIKSDGNKLSEGEKTCLTNCQTNYHILDNIYQKTASMNKLAYDQIVRNSKL